MQSKQRTNDWDVEENMNHQNDGTELELESANGVFELEIEQISEKETEWGYKRAKKDTSKR